MSPGDLSGHCLNILKRIPHALSSPQNFLVTQAAACFSPLAFQCCKPVPMQTAFSPVSSLHCQVLTFATQFTCGTHCCMRAVERISHPVGHEVTVLFPPHQSCPMGMMLAHGSKSLMPPVINTPHPVVRCLHR